MKERPLSNCERKFIYSALAEQKRIDGRELSEHRELDIYFGTDYGSCYVSMGESKAMAQIMYEIEEPSASKPSEGLVFVNCDVGGMAAGHFETNRQSDLGVRLSRVLEKGIRDSGAVDLEALCIVAEDKVWVLRVEVTVLNHDGGLFCCCSVAALGALLTARLPQITWEDDTLTVHSPKDRAPTPLSILHFPVAVSFALFHDGKVAVVDPTELEERVQESELIFYMNSYREVCGVLFGGRPVSGGDLMVKCARVAAHLADSIIKRLRSVLDTYTKQREKELSGHPGFVEIINLDRVLAASQDRTAVKTKARLANHGGPRSPSPTVLSDSDEEATDINTDSKGTGVLPPTSFTKFGSDWVPSGGQSTWERVESNDSDSSDEESDDESDVEVTGVITEKERTVAEIELNDDSEEEETTTIHGKHLENT